MHNIIVAQCLTGGGWKRFRRREPRWPGSASGVGWGTDLAGAGSEFFCHGDDVDGNKEVYLVARWWLGWRLRAEGQNRRPTFAGRLPGYSGRRFTVAQEADGLLGLDKAGHGCHVGAEGVDGVSDAVVSEVFVALEEVVAIAIEGLLAVTAWCGAR